MYDFLIIIIFIALWITDILLLRLSIRLWRCIKLQDKQIELQQKQLNAYGNTMENIIGVVKIHNEALARIDGQSKKADDKTISTRK